MSKSSLSLFLSVASVIVIAACGDDDSSGAVGAGGGGRGGSAGSAGSGGRGGSAGSAGSGGSAGSAGSGGSAGSAGAAGASGAAGAAGAAGVGGSLEIGDAGAGDAGGAVLGFFVASTSDSGGDLAGIDGADALCETLAAEVGAGNRTWRAYLSTTGDDGEDAIDRIGDGPWANANGVIIADNVVELHALTGDVDLFVDHEGNPINGQWAGSPTPNEHDILTGSNPDGTAAANNCENWTSSTATPGPIVGHADGLGPGMNGAAPFNSWNSSHAPAGCSQAQLVAVGGAGRFYCFAAD